MKSDPKKQYSNIKTISGFPAGEAGYDLGVSACYGGFIGDYMVVAGGCNFPEPGKKKYYSGIYAARVGGNANETLGSGKLHSLKARFLLGREPK